MWDLSRLGIQLASPAWQGRLLTTEPPWKPLEFSGSSLNFIKAILNYQLDCNLVCLVFSWWRIIFLFVIPDLSIHVCRYALLLLQLKQQLPS